MSLMSKTKRRIENILAWVLAIAIIALLLAGVAYVAGAV